MYKLCRHRDTYSAKYIVVGILYEDSKMFILKGNEKTTEKVQDFFLLLIFFFNSVQYSFSSKPTSILFLR